MVGSQLVLDYFNKEQREYFFNSSLFPAFNCRNLLDSSAHEQKYPEVVGPRDSGFFR